MNSTAAASVARPATSPALRSFDVEIAGCRIRSSTNSVDAERALARCVFPGIDRLTYPGDADVFVRVEEGENRFQLFLNDVLIATPHTLTSLETQTIRALDDAIVARLRGWWAIHAGVVAWSRQAILLPGSTYSGKSTLVAELVRLGATYFSDEYALLDSEGRVHAYPRPMLLRNGNPGAVATPATNVATTPALVRWIMALHYEPGCEWKLTPIDQSEAMMVLLRSTPHILSGTPRLVRPLEKAVGSAQCFFGCRPEAAQAACEILRLMS